MVNHRASDAASTQAPIAPIVKRKRRASCLGEQERRERKRAIDREAQRSLREKTKTHIAELERTIQILRDQDRHGTTSSLLSEIDVLRAENERLREVIDNVKSVIGCDLLPRNTATSVGPGDGGMEHSPVASSVGQRSPKPRTVSFANDTKPATSPPAESPTLFDYQEPVQATTKPLDLDGMTIMTSVENNTPAVPDAGTGMDLDLQPASESPEHDAEDLPWGNDPATATWAPLMAEFFGPNWRCPSPVVLHIGNPEPTPTSVSSAICPVWKKSNELFGKVFSYRSSATGTCPPSSEAGLLYLGIHRGWDTTSNEWMQSPVLQILKQVDDLLFCHLSNIERLAVAYMSFKLLKYYLNGTKDELDKVPEWLRPSLLQAATKHPIAVDFLAWHTLRNRLVQNHDGIFTNCNLSKCCVGYLRFDWPFAFEDAFFLDERQGMYYPSPLFERHHRDLKYWNVDPKFYQRFPEMRTDIEGDRQRFTEIEVC